MTYIDFLRQTGVPLFDGAGIYWQVCRGGLIPALPLPTFVDMDLETGRQLLAKSGAYFARWSSEPSIQQTSWWWIVCDSYNLAQLSSKMRNQIKRGYKECIVRRVSASWLADFGYECYKSAFHRYNYATYASETDFRSRTLSRAEYETVFEYWGVFIEDQLVGYAECTVEGEDGVATTVIKYNPDFLRKYTSYAMMDTLLKYYVAERGLPMSNGARSVSHDTNVQDFLLKFAFRRQYCRLNVQYRRSIGLAVSLLYPFRKFLPGWGGMHNVKALLFQEELKRACQGSMPGGKGYFANNDL